MVTRKVKKNAGKQHCKPGVTGHLENIGEPLENRRRTRVVEAACREATENPH